jgi:hypothetical protein
MTEQEIRLLGFQIQHDDGGGHFDPYYYFTYKVANGLSFISNANDEIKEDGKWFVEFFNTEPAIRFTEFAEVQALLNTLDKHKIIKDE